VVALQAAHHREAELASEIGILAKRFLAGRPTPARIAENLMFGVQNVQPLVLPAMAGATGRVMFRARPRRRMALATRPMSSRFHVAASAMTCGRRSRDRCGRPPMAASFHQL